ncbi:MAG: hypothetical protein JKY94_07585 [Rhodobacteraceae bacterium]|nr:hypothetical protein [Paracoccaceae bacterium]
MQKLQQMRVALVLLLSEEHTKLQRQHRRLAGMEIEIMGAERDHAAGTLPTAKLDQLYKEDRVTKETLEEIETEITRMEQVLAKIDVDIVEMCRS